MLPVPDHNQPPDAGDDAVDRRLQEEGIHPTRETGHSVLVTFAPPNDDSAATRAAYFDAIVTALGAELHDHACIIVNRDQECLQIRVACVTAQLRTLLGLLLRYETKKRFALERIELEDTSPTEEMGGEGGA